ncbi:MAG: Rrf2 family transcriptional regulator [Firmicutes bacterium]|nr:Rrf2 family transcriptional regulator [Bacillota bacterium]
MIGNKAEYFLKVLIELARNKGQDYLTSREIAQRQGIPPKYIPQIVAALSKQGWLDSSRGPKGGVRLAVAPADISVAQVVDLAEGGVAVKKCLFSDPPCPMEECCSLFPVWQEAQSALQEVFSRYSIADLTPPKGGEN